MKIIQSIITIPALLVFLAVATNSCKAQTNYSDAASFYDSFWGMIETNYPSIPKTNASAREYKLLSECFSSEEYELSSFEEKLLIWQKELTAEEQYLKQLLQREDLRKKLSYTFGKRDVSLTEFRLSNGTVYGVSTHFSLPEDPIPNTNPKDVKKIIYGYSVTKGIVIEDQSDIHKIITTLKTKTVRPHQYFQQIPIEGNDSERPFSVSSVHGCTLAVRIILDDGSVVGSFGHIEEGDRNPELASLFIQAINEDRVTFVGGASQDILINPDN